MDNKYWYVIYVRSRYEKKVHQLLQEKGIESSLPLIKTVRIWSDRKKKVEVPLFKGYVFVNIDIQKDKYNVLQSNGVVKFLTLKKEPSRVPSKQMYWLNIMVKELDTPRHETIIPIGQKVRVVIGPLKGAEGIVMRKGNKSRLVVFMETIMQAVSVEINPDYLEFF